jgi:hypothetical protein
MNEPERSAQVVSSPLQRVPTALRDEIVAPRSDAFAHDVLDTDELERRVTIAQTAESIAEVEGLVADLSAAARSSSTALALARPNPLLPERDVQAAGHVVSAAGHARRCEPWAVPRRLTVVNMIGKTTLDFRVAELPAGPVEVVIGSVIGRVTIVTPPGLPVVADGLAIMGDFDHVERAPRAPEPGTPVLHVRGFAALGKVHVEMRLPGESAQQARKRRRKESP